MPDRDQQPAASSTDAPVAEAGGNVEQPAARTTDRRREVAEFPGQLSADGHRILPPADASGAPYTPPARAEAGHHVPAAAEQDTPAEAPTPTVRKSPAGANQPEAETRTARRGGSK